jgi:hypothetical protein
MVITILDEGGNLIANFLCFISPSDMKLDHKSEQMSMLSKEVAAEVTTPNVFNL